MSAQLRLGCLQESVSAMAGVPAGVSGGSQWLLFFLEGSGWGLNPGLPAYSVFTVALSHTTKPLVIFSVI